MFPLIKACFSPTVKDLRSSLYPDLLIIFDGASAFPVEAEAHQVNAENAGEGFDARPLHSGSLRGQTNAHDLNTQQQPAGIKCMPNVMHTFSLHFSQ